MGSGPFDHDFWAAIAQPALPDPEPVTLYVRDANGVLESTGVVYAVAQSWLADDDDLASANVQYGSESQWWSLFDNGESERPTTRSRIVDSSGICWQVVKFDVFIRRGAWSCLCVREVGQ